MPEPDLTPEEEQVRRLLADARHDEPMPADVGDRLDRVLADLRPSPAAAPAPDRLREVAAAQRRRRLRNLVLAAAAVVVVGVGISRIDLSGMSGADSGNAGSADQSVQGEAHESGGGSAPEGSAAEAAPTTLRLRSGTFEQQVERYAETGRLALVDQLRSTAADAEQDTADDDTYAARCANGDLGPGRRVPATYDGQPAVLVVRPAGDGVRRVDLYLCGSVDPVRSTTVPRR